MQIRDVMTESVVTAPEAATVREVAELMRERNVGSVVLVDGAGGPAGVITDRDLAVSVLAGGARAVRSCRRPRQRSGDCHLPRRQRRGGSGADDRPRHAPAGSVEGDRLSGIVTLDDLAVRTGDLELAQRLTSEITRAALPGFFFHHRGG